VSLVSAPNALVVVWRVTEVCHLGCVFCGYSRELRRSRTQAAAADVLAFGAALGGHAVRTGREVLVSWLGGEPLLWPPLTSVGPRLRALGLSLGVTTNGARLTPEMCRHLVEHYAQVTVSVDGLAGWHDRVRQSPGLWDRARAGVERLAGLRAQSGRGPRLRVNTVLMRSNLGDFTALCAAVAAWGADEVTFNALGGVERGGAFYERERLRPEDIAALRAVLPEARARLAASGLTICGTDLYLDRLAALARGAAWPVDDCGPGRNFLFVDERGRIGPCAFTTGDFGLTWRDLRAAEALEALPHIWRERQARQRPAACADCRSTQVFEKFAPQPSPVSAT